MGEEELRIETQLQEWFGLAGVPEPSSAAEESCVSGVRVALVPAVLGC